MPITNQQLQEKFLDALRAIESAEPTTKGFAEIEAARVALTKGKQALDRVGPPPVISAAKTSGGQTSGGQTSGGRTGGRQP
jgi:hypothetical protein